MMMKKQRPFKKFYCDRSDIFLIPACAFKIWMYHFAREGGDRKSWPSVKTVMDACGFTRKPTFYKWRGYLITNGWLEKVGEVPSRTDGGRPIPIFTVKRGTIPAKVRKALRTTVSKSVTNPEQKALLTPSKKRNKPEQKALPEVDTTEVDSKNKVKPIEVEEPLKSVRVFSSGDSGTPDKPTPKDGLSAAEKVFVGFDVDGNQMFARVQ